MRGVNKRPLAEVLTEFVQDLEEHIGADGNTYFTGICPFHNDTNPSFYIYPNDDDEHSYCGCFTCWDGGDAIDFFRKLWPDVHMRDILAVCTDRASPEEIIRKDIQSIINQKAEIDYVSFAMRMHELLQRYSLNDCLHIFKQVEQLLEEEREFDAREILVRYGV